MEKMFCAWKAKRVAIKHVRVQCSNIFWFVRHATLHLSPVTAISCVSENQFGKTDPNF